MRLLLCLAAVMMSTTAFAGPLDLSHSGRLLDSGGDVLEGNHRLDLTLYNSSGSALTTWTFNPVTLQGGYYSVTLSGLDTGWFAGDLSLGVAVDQGDELTPRHSLASVPHAQRAAIADGVAVDVDGTGATCSVAGQMVLDQTGPDLKICDGGNWRIVAAVGPRTIQLAGGTRTWSDGTYAASCEAYRHPTDPDHVYIDNAQTGDGTYTIDPLDGSPLKVWCDMTFGGGGWTKVMSLGPNTLNLGTTASVNADGAWTGQGNGTALGKVSAATWAALWSNTAFLMRVNAPSDAKLMGNGSGSLLWTATGGTQFPAWGTGYRPTSYTLACDYTGDGLADDTQSYTSDTRATCAYGTTWLYDHNYTADAQCFGFETTRLRTNLHFCGNGPLVADRSEGGVTGTHHIFVRD